MRVWYSVVAAFAGQDIAAAGTAASASGGLARMLSASWSQYGYVSVTGDFSHVSAESSLER